VRIVVKKICRIIDYFVSPSDFNAWNDPECDAIRGTELLHFGNFLNKNSKVWWTFADFCRYLIL
jgi:hypothetical protein